MDFKKMNIWLALLLVAVMVMGQGCALLDPIEKGTKTTEYYDDNGKLFKTVEEDYAIGDKYTEYTDSVEAVSGANAESTSKKIDAVLSLTAVTVDDSKEVAAWKQTSGLLAINGLDDNAAEVMANIKYGKDKYDVSESAVGTVGSVGNTSVLTYGGMRVLDSAFDAAGDRMSNTGSNNTIEKQELDNEIHANTTGDNSAPNVDVESSAKCKGGDCEEAEPEQYIDENGNCRVSPNCSCDSYNAGECS